MSFFFFNDTATTEIYTLSLHDALPIFADREDLPEGRRAGDRGVLARAGRHRCPLLGPTAGGIPAERPSTEGDLLITDRKSTRLNSSHANISYAVFCLKKKKTND